ncbi:MAG: adenosylcobinamide amidohydrolase [Proteobacteria bacterium]|nr:adenosylcobinamide amidohydrolase [Pseudomonadota bacterium]MBU4294707.1 adenosylcobinamide amidohydrolase [Pseudomonadota bacterium]MCG2749792.1 helical backbone metal receptor [Desulfobulbaceae bacterium]
MKNMQLPKVVCCLLVFSFLCLLQTESLLAWPVSGTDSQGQAYVIEQRPQRVVCLVPEISEILFAIGADDALVGITRHTVTPAAAAQKKVVGGFFAPGIKEIAALNPDFIFVADLHEEVRAHFQNKCRLLTLNVSGIDSAMERIELLGRIFGREEAARKVVAENRELLTLIARKVAGIPAEKRQRAVRIMGSESLMVPGDDSFQNDFIRAAGAIPPRFGENGKIISISPEQWRQFDPQVVYGCGGGKPAILEAAGGREVSAMQNNRFFSFPCDFTCRGGVNVGNFVAWLAARIYSEEFSDPAKQVRADQLLGEKTVAVDLPYVRRVRVVESSIRDFTNRTLLVDFKTPQTILSSLEGPRSKILTVGNHYYPAPTWGLGHDEGVEAMSRRTCAVLTQSPEDTSLLFTGADMDNLAISRQDFKEMTVYALVTAGVKSNAVRMGRDTGNFYEPGTINVLIFTNMQLSSRAMTRAMISATEGKTAALNDLDIRSSYSPNLPATGTGTDNILVVQGEGPAIDNAGGHSKMGELIARSVYDGVLQAVAKQNGITRERSISTRLGERHISLWRLLPDEMAGCNRGKAATIAQVERLLIDSQYAGFMAAAFAASDAEQAGLLTDLRAFGDWGRTVSSSISHTADSEWQHRFAPGDLPPVLAIAFESLINGVCAAETSPVAP